MGEVPRDSFALAVGVGCKVHGIGFCSLSLEVFYQRAFIALIFILRLEVMFYIHAEL